MLKLHNLLTPSIAARSTPVNTPRSLYYWHSVSNHQRRYAYLGQGHARDGGVCGTTLSLISVEYQQHTLLNRAEYDRHGSVNGSTTIS